MENKAGRYKVKKEIFKILFLIFVLCFYLAGCSEEDLPLSKSQLKSAQPEQELRKFNIVQTNNDRKQWELEAQEAQIYEKTNRAIAKDIRVKFFEDESVSSILTAERGTLNTDSGDMEVEGNVVVTSLVQKTKIETEKLRYIAKEEKIVSDEFVKQTREDAIITGYGLETDPGLRKVVIKKDVKAEVIEPKKKGQ